MKQNLYSSKLRRQGSGFGVGALVEGIRSQVNTNGVAMVSPEVARSSFAMEAIDEARGAQLDQAIGTLQHALESVATTVARGAKYTAAQMDAAVATGLMTGNIPEYLRAPVEHNVMSTENEHFVPSEAIDASVSGRLQEALEAYDERDNKNAVVYSIAYNMQAARQDEFGEAFFPTVVVTPDQVGLVMSIRLIQVYDEVRRQTTGALDSFNKKNIVKAVIDPTILRNDTMRIIPIVTAGSASKFVNPALVAPVNVVVEGSTEVVSTAPLAMGQSFSLLGISQTQALLDTGVQDTTDSIDAAIRLSGLYLHVFTPAAGANPQVDEVIPFSTAMLPGATFNYAVQGLHRQMNLNFSTKSLLVNKLVKTVAGAASAVLNAIIAGQYSVQLAVNVSGSVNLELADTNLMSGAVSVAAVYDAAGNSLDITAGPGLTIANLFAGATMIGYDLEARRTNVNRRMRGQLLDTTFYNQVYNVPLLSPLTVPRPLTTGDTNDATDLAALITATHIRTSNAAVAALLEAEMFLADYVRQGSQLGADSPDILGVSRFMLSAFYEYAAFDVSTHVDSLKSSERANDVQQALVNKLRDMAYRMYRDSGYKAFADAMCGGQAPVPTIIIGTDPVISRYLSVVGDFRTLGNDFNVRVVSTLNKNMAGKIRMSFGMFEGYDGVANPMHFGNMAWKPELTLVLPLHRNGANSKELTVQPAFRHIVNLPIMAAVDVTGLSDVMVSKVTVNMHTIP